MNYWTSNSCINLASKQDNQLIGKINLSFNRQTGHIYGFCVNPAHQGQGIGTAMIAAVLKQYQARWKRSRWKWPRKTGWPFACTNDAAFAWFRKMTTTLCPSHRHPFLGD
jgi:ribosomal protein S18 acetylase RimI-like enzyme